MKKYTFISLFFSFSLFSQNGLIGNGFGSNDWSTTDCFSASAGNSRILTTTSNGTGDRHFRLVDCWNDQWDQWSPVSNIDTQLLYNNSYDGSNFNGNSTSGAFYVSANSSYNYVFKTREGDQSTVGLILFEVQGFIRSVLSVNNTSVVSPGNDYTVTATLDGALSTGQGIYLRYTDDSWANSTIVAMSGSSTTYAANIPSSVNTSGSSISYYVFTSGDGLTITHSDADFYTINYDNNSNNNYSYSVPDYGQVYVYLSDYGSDAGLADQYLALMGASEVNTEVTPPAVTAYTTNTSSPFYKFKSGEIGSSSISLAAPGTSATLLASGSGSDLDSVLEELGPITANDTGQIIIVFPAGSDMTFPTSIQEVFNNTPGGAVPQMNVDNYGWYIESGILHSITLDTPHLGFNEWYVFGRKSQSAIGSEFRIRLIPANGSALGIESDELITNFKAVYQNDGVVLVGDFMLDDKVEIYDIMGRLTQTHTISGNHSVIINKDELATGVCLAKINRNGNSKTIKFIIN